MAGSPTDAADAEVYRVDYEGDDTNGFIGLLERFRIDLPKLALTFEQVELFCLEHDDWLRDHYKSSRGYHFLIKNKAENLFVGKMGFGHSGRYIDIKEIRKNDCGAYCYVGSYIVVQQQTD